MKTKKVLLLLTVSVLLMAIFSGCSKNVSVGDINNTSESDVNTNVTSKQTEKSSDSATNKVEPTKATDARVTKKNLIFDEKDFTLNGIGIGSSKDEIKTAFGNPTNNKLEKSVYDCRKQNVNYETMNYDEEMIYGSLENGIEFDLASGKVVKIRITENSIKTTKGIKVGDNPKNLENLYANSVYQHDKAGGHAGTSPYQIFLENANADKGCMYFMCVVHGAAPPPKDAYVCGFGVVDNKKNIPSFICWPIQ